MSLIYHQASVFRADVFLFIFITHEAPGSSPPSYPHPDVPGVKRGASPADVLLSTDVTWSEERNEGEGVPIGRLKSADVHLEKANNDTSPSASSSP